MSTESNTSPTSNPRTLIIQPDEGKTLHAFGDTLQIKLNGEETNGSLALGLGSTPPGHGPPPHIHHHEDELFIILEGGIRFLRDDSWTDHLRPGTVIYTPRGVRHTFQNGGATLARHWVLATPSGFERFFGQCAEVFAAGGPPDMAKILALSSDYGLEFVPLLQS